MDSTISVSQRELEELRAYIKTGRIHRDQYVHWGAWSGTKCMTLEEACAWVAKQRKKLMDTQLRIGYGTVEFDENRLYNIHTGETIPFSALQN